MEILDESAIEANGFEAKYQVWRNDESRIKITNTFRSLAKDIKEFKQKWKEYVYANYDLENFTVQLLID